MSLSEQWSPTSVQVTVLQARGLRIKGKNGTNDAYAVIQLAKEKYQTSVAEKSVAPVWKEEASFDMPSAHQGSTERGVLHVHVLHRALVGPDKLLGQAVINLLQLHEDKDRDKTQWFKLVDKSGKSDKDRGELLVDIQFTRNNMTASMFDISAAGKSRSRLGKFKDKVRGKKKEDSLSETSSSVVAVSSQVMTDSEDGGDSGSEAAGREHKKKSKVKSLFSHKTNLQKSFSQSMSVLPGKDSSLSGSVSSGLNVETSEGKKKFKFLSHKRTGSSDKKEKLVTEQSNLCINGSHVYCEEPAPRTSRTSSNFSLASSGVGSMEDVPDSSPPSVGSRRSVRHSSPWTEEEEEEEQAVEENTPQVDEDMVRRREREKMEEEAQRREEEERMKREEEELRLQEEKERQMEKIKLEQERLQKEEEEKRAAEMMRVQEERKKQEEEMRRIEEEKQRRREEEEKEKERIRLEDEKKRCEEEEEKRRQEEEEETRQAAERKALEKRRQQEKEEELRKMEERMRKERLLEEERKRQEEEERREEELRIGKEREERRRIEEAQKLEEERKRLEEEEKIRFEREMERQREEEELLRKREEQRRLEEEKQRLELQQEQERREEEERKRLEEEERIRFEREMERQREEELLRKEREEQRRLEEEKRRLQLQQEQERREGEEKMRVEEEMKRKRKEEEEEQRVRKEREEYERMRAEQRKLEEEELKRQMKEEEALEKDRLAEKERRREEEERRRKEEERRREEEERRRKEEERRREEEERGAAEEAQRRSKTAPDTHHSTSINPFDDGDEDFPDEETEPRSTGRVSSAQRCKLPVERNTCSFGDASTTREKRQAPKPPRMTSSGRPQAARHEAQIRDKEIKTASVLPQRAAQNIPLSGHSSQINNNNQPEHFPRTARGSGRRPAPQRPSLTEEEHLLPKDPLLKTKPPLAVSNSNPFEEDEDVEELGDAAAPTTEMQPDPEPRSEEKGTVSSVKIKSSKAAHAPAPPVITTNAPSIDTCREVTISHVIDNKDGAAVLQPSPEEHEAVQEEAVKDTPPVPSRRLQPVKPLNPQDQKPVPSIHEEKDKKSNGEISSRSKENVKYAGPYALLTQEELISLVLKQESQLLEKSNKISELEQYIDNLLVRVIEEAPNVLMNMIPLK